MTLPKDCNNIKMCEKAKALLGKKTSKRSGNDEIVVNLEGTIKSKSSFKIAAKLDVEEAISETLTLTGYELIVEADNGGGSVFFGVIALYKSEDANLELKGICFENTGPPMLGAGEGAGSHGSSIFQLSNLKARFANAKTIVVIA